MAAQGIPCTTICRGPVARVDFFLLTVRAPQLNQYPSYVLGLLAL